jgi:hypothetical protein
MPRPSHPEPNVRDDRETPLCAGRDGERYAGDLGQKETEIFLQRGLDDPNQIERKGEFSFTAQGLHSNVGQVLIEIGSDRGVARMSAARCGVKLAIDLQDIATLIRAMLANLIRPTRFQIIHGPPNPPKCRTTEIVKLGKRRSQRKKVCWILCFVRKRLGANRPQARAK